MKQIGHLSLGLSRMTDGCIGQNHSKLRQLAAAAPPPAASTSRSTRSSMSHCVMISADHEQNRHEPQPGELHQDQKIEPPPDAPPEAQARRRAQAAFVVGGSGWS